MADNAARAAQLVRALEVSVLGETASLDELFTKDVTGVSPVLTVSSLEELAVELEEREGAFSEIEIDVVPLDVAGDRACVEWVASAVHSGPLFLDEDESVALDPTGNRVTLRGASVAEFEGDRIRAFRHYWDDVELIVGLGLLGD